MEILNFILQTLSAGALASALILLVGKFFSDRSLEQHKAALVQETERLKFEFGKDVESHKWKMKKREIIFQKEFEAASDFFELRRMLEPRYRNPDMEWADAVDDVVDGFSRSEGRLRKFIAKHGPILSDRNRELLDRCEEIASLNQYAKIQDQMKEAETAVEEFLEKLKAAEKIFVKELRRD